MTPLERVREYFKTLPISLEIILFNESTRTSQLAAQALGVETGQIAKTLVFSGKTNGEDITAKNSTAAINSTLPLLANSAASLRLPGGVVVVTSGDVKVDQKRLKRLVGFKPRLAGEKEVLALTGYPPGGVCPFDLPQDLPVYIDVSMRRFPVVYSAAGTANSAVPITVDQLLRVTGGELCDVCYPG